MVMLVNVSRRKLQQVNAYQINWGHLRGMLIESSRRWKYDYRNSNNRFNGEFICIVSTTSDPCGSLLHGAVV